MCIKLGFVYMWLRRNLEFLSLKAFIYINRFKEYWVLRHKSQASSIPRKQGDESCNASNPFPKALPVNRDRSRQVVLGKSRPKAMCHLGWGQTEAPCSMTQLWSFQSMCPASGGAACVSTSSTKSMFKYLQQASNWCKKLCQSLGRFKFPVHRTF